MKKTWITLPEALEQLKAIGVIITKAGFLKYHRKHHPKLTRQPDGKNHCVWVDKELLEQLYGRVELLTLSDAEAIWNSQPRLCSLTHLFEVEPIYVVQTHKFSRRWVKKDLFYKALNTLTPSDAQSDGCASDQSPTEPSQPVA